MGYPYDDGAAEHEAANEALCSEHRVKFGLSSDTDDFPEGIMDCEDMPCASGCPLLRRDGEEA